MTLDATRTRPRALDAISAADFREAMSSLASGVVIVTSWLGRRPWGTTVTAFASVSAEPPTILVSLRSDTTSARAIDECIARRSASTGFTPRVSRGRFALGFVRDSVTIPRVLLSLLRQGAFQNVRGRSADLWIDGRRWNSKLCSGGSGANSSHALPTSSGTISERSFACASVQHVAIATPPHRVKLARR